MYYFLFILPCIYCYYYLNNNNNNDNDYKNIINKYFDNIILELKDKSKYNQKETKSSINYLQKKDVREDTIKILKDLNCIEIKGPLIENILKLYFVEIVAITKDKKFLLNYWPCNKSCITIEELK